MKGLKKYLCSEPKGAGSALASCFLPPEFFIPAAPREGEPQEHPLGALGSPLEPGTFLPTLPWHPKRSWHPQLCPGWAEKSNNIKYLILTSAGSFCCGTSAPVKIQTKPPQFISKGGIGNVSKAGDNALKSVFWDNYGRQSTAPALSAGQEMACREWGEGREELLPHFTLGPDL